MENPLNTTNAGKAGKPVKDDNHNTIPLEEAIERIRVYREVASRIFPPENVPKAIFIPIDDVMEIIEKYNRREEVSGIRVYFSQLTDEPETAEVRGLVVPVRKDMTDIVDSGPDGESSIYDFTMPCPTQCDIKSRLFLAE